MLYECWRKTVRNCGSATAVTDALTGRSWTFLDLDRESSANAAPGQPVIFPQTDCVEFILQILRAWKARIPACPLEPGHHPPELRQKPPRHFAHLKTTSATTGKPRLVAFTGDQLAADANNLVSTMSMRPDWPNVAAISLAHSYGFSNLVLPLLLHGIPLILARAALPEALKRAAGLANSITLPGVPALWRMWHEAGAIPPNLRLAMSAGAPLPLPLEKAVFETWGVKIHNFYGSSECGGIAYDRTDRPRPGESVAGSAVDNVKITIGDNGCVVVSGPAVGSGYWPDATDTLSNGVFRTSDLGEFNGPVLSLKGRIGDLINVAGRKVSPELIEQALASHPGVIDCLAFGVPAGAGHRGESIVACVTLRSNTTTDDLKHFAASSLRAWQMPRDWWVVDSMQTNGRGKLSRIQWKQKYLERKAAQRRG